MGNDVARMERGVSAIRDAIKGLQRHTKRKLVRQKVSLKIFKYVHLKIFWHPPPYPHISV